MGSRSSIGCLGGAAKVAALFVAILFLIVLPISIFALDIGGVFFSPESLSSAVVESVTGSQVGQQFINDEIMPNLVTDTAPTDEFDFTRAFSALDQGDRDQIVSLLVAEDWLERQIIPAVSKDRWCPRPESTSLSLTLFWLREWHGQRPPTAQPSRPGPSSHCPAVEKFWRPARSKNQPLHPWFGSQ